MPTVVRNRVWRALPMRNSWTRSRYEVGGWGGEGGRVNRRGVRDERAQRRRKVSERATGGNSRRGRGIGVGRVICECLKRGWTRYEREMESYVLYGSLVSLDFLAFRLTQAATLDPGRSLLGVKRPTTPGSLAGWRWDVQEAKKVETSRTREDLLFFFLSFCSVSAAHTIPTAIRTQRRSA